MQQHKKDYIPDTSETLTYWNTKVSVFPDRWWLIKSIEINGTEILYQDMYVETLLDLSKSVKWGIPFMFPNAWPLTDEEKQKSWFNLPQHWIWRINTWSKQVSSKQNMFTQSFVFDKNDDFPFRWEIKNNIELIESSIKIVHEIINNWEIDMPISTWLHPYFRVPEWKKQDIKWNFEWWDKIAKQVNIWANDWTITFENTETPLSIFIPSLWELTIEVSPEYKKFWVWSLPEKDFVCIEPVMEDEWWIVNNPIMVTKNKKNINFMKIYLER